MKSKLDKIDDWLDGYIMFDYTAISKEGKSYTSLPTIKKLAYNNKILGIVTDGRFVMLPAFEDDKPELKDKALQEYIEFMQSAGNTTKEINANIETNNRIKDLEAAVARLEAANEEA